MLRKKAVMHALPERAATITFSVSEKQYITSQAGTLHMHGVGTIIRPPGA